MIKPRISVVILRILSAVLFLLPNAFAIAQNAAPTPPLSSNSQPKTHGANENTVLRCSDVVKITVYGEDDLTTEALIGKDGTIRFPLLGQVVLAGKTVEQATEQIRGLLGARYIRNPQVTLTISSYAKQWVTVLGEVKKPGEIEIPDEGGLDLLGAIAQAGGFTDIAEISHITVRRLVNGKDEIFEVDARRLAHDSTVKPFYVQSGDTITVRQRLF